MIHRILPILLLLLASCAQVTRLPPNDPPETGTLAERTHKAVVLIAYGPRVHGSGFAVSPNQILTAKHVVEDASQAAMAEIVTEDGQTCTPVGIRASRDQDYSILTVTGCRLSWLRMRSSPAVLGEDVYLAGHPYEDRQTWTRGVVSNVFDGKNKIGVDAVALPGMSGGPAVDADGYVIGIVSFGELAIGLNPAHRRVWGGQTFLVPTAEILIR